MEQRYTIITNMCVMISDDSSDDDFASHFLDIGNSRDLLDENIIKVRN